MVVGVGGALAAGVGGYRLTASAFTLDCSWTQDTRTVAMGSGIDNSALGGASVAEWELAIGEPRLIDVVPSSGGADITIDSYDFGNISVDGSTLAPNTAFDRPVCVDGYRTAGGQVVVYNSYYSEFYGADEARNVYSHELGHALGLGHNDALASCRPLALMNSFTSVRLDPECGVNGPTADDVAGIGDAVGK